MGTKVPSAFKAHSSASLCTLTVEQTKALLTIDAKKLSPSNANKFVKDNYLQAYLLINTWFLQIEDALGFQTAHRFKVHVRSVGLSDLISLCASAADVFISIADDMVNEDYVWDQPVPIEFFNDFTGLELGSILQLLRYPKRFTWVAAEVLKEESLRKMADINLNIFKRESDFECFHLDYPHMIVDRMAHYYEVILKDFRKFYDAELPDFSSGVCRDGKNTPEKLNAIAKYREFWISPTYPLYSKDKDPEDPLNIVKAIGVPKSYKQYRVITPMVSVYAAELQRVRRAWEKCLASSGYDQYFDVHDQDPNREAAKLGSSGIDNYITVDMSSASDTISRNLVLYELLPVDVREVITPLLEEFLIFSLKTDYHVVHECFMFGASGNPITFVNEGTFFLSAALTSRDIMWDYARKRTLEPHIFGDDAVIDGELYTLYSEILTSLGCIVNHEKTFTAGGYRESCGSEFYNGMEVSSNYWPRKEFVTSSFSPNSRNFADTVLSLCSLQHKVWESGLARIFVEDFIRELVPDMTSSPIGSDCTDLWSYLPSFAKRSAPHKGKINCDPSVTLREAHYGAVTLADKAGQSANSASRKNVDTYLYTAYLAKGPQYSEDPLCRALGLTEPRSVVFDSKTILKKIVK